MDLILTKELAFLTTALSVLAIAAYIISFCIRHGVPYSLSDTYYIIKHPILFSLTMWTTAALVIFGIAVASGTHTQWYGYLAVAGLFVVGAAPRFKQRHQRPIHELGAALAVLGTVLWVAFNYPAVLLMWLAFAVYKLLHLFFRNRFDKPLFAIEIVAFATFYTALFIKISQL